MKSGSLYPNRNAHFSDCRAYRYSLRIIWDPDRPIAAFVGLNPSTADEVNDDPTIRRCSGFAERFKCGGMLMLNLFSYRATDPIAMLRCDAPVGVSNGLKEMRARLEECKGPWIACWGTHGKHLDRGPWLRNLIPELQCLGRNTDGSPKHPLYLPADAPLFPYGCRS